MLQHAVQGPMPLIGNLLEPATRQHLRIVRTLDLAEDLYLNDHLFIHAPGVKPPRACLPVMPMTFSLELMAETAACLLPGNGLIGFERVQATQWIDLQDEDRLVLEVSAGHSGHERAAGTHRVRVTVRKQGAGSHAISATVLLGRRYQADLTMVFHNDDALHPFPLTMARIYGERFLFHGPTLRCIDRITATSPKTIVATIKARVGKNLFRSSHQPLLLTAPHLMDAMAQLLVAWFFDKSWWALPMSIEKIEMYRPAPVMDSVLPVLVQVRNFGRKTLTVDLEAQDGARNVWLRIKNWRFWIMRFKPAAANFLRLPQDYLLAGPGRLTNSPAKTVCRILRFNDLTEVNLAWLARTCLHLDEMPLYFKLSARPAEQRCWLATRAAAKDAARLWLARETSIGLLHPAAFFLIDKAEGYAVGPVAGMAPSPEIKIIRADGMSAAIAHPAQAAPDIKKFQFVDSDMRLESREAAACS